MEALAEVPVKRALVARAAEARDVLPDALRERGAEVDVVALYETVAEPLDQAALEAVAGADYVTFTSSSTVRFLLRPRAIRLAPARAAGQHRSGDQRDAPRARARARRGGDPSRHRRAGRGAGRRRVAGAGGAVSTPVITFLSDYGLEDDFVGVCHAVIAGLCPEARVIDLVHGVPRDDVRAGALMLRGALPLLPVGVHLAVVDPGVGGRAPRGRVAAAPTGGCWSAPTTGCWRRRRIAPAAWSRPSTSGPRRSRSRRYRRRSTGATCSPPWPRGWPAGPRSARPATPLDPAALVALELPARAGRRRGRWWRTCSTSTGSATSSWTSRSLLASAVGRVSRSRRRSGRAGRPLRAGRSPTSGAGELLLYEDADRRLAVAVNQGDAAARLELAVDDELRIRSE